MRPLRTLLYCASRACTIGGFIFIIYGHLINVCNEQIVFWPFSWGAIMLPIGAALWIVDAWPTAMESWKQILGKPVAVQRWLTVFRVLIFASFVMSYVAFLYLLDYFSNC